jgi:acetyl-CoA acetyltransferase
MDVYVLGSAMTPFGRFPEKTHKQLTRDAVTAALADAGLSSGERIDSVHFGTCAMHLFGQSNVCGQTALSPLVTEGLLKQNIPVTNLEAACATGAVAFHGAWKDIASGSSEVSLAVGVDKTFLPDRPKMMIEMFNAAVDQQNPDLWKTYYQEAAEACGRAFEPIPERIMLLDVCAMQTQWHMKTYGTTQRQLAIVAAKNHRHSVHNEKSQYRKPMEADDVLADKTVLGALTRSCALPSATERPRRSFVPTASSPRFPLPPKLAR